MKELRIQQVEIHPDSIEDALRQIDDAIARHQEMREILERLRSIQGGGPVKRRVGRPRNSDRARSAASTAAAPAARGRRPAGSKTLRETILEVLSKQSTPLKPKDLKQAVLDAGFQTRATPSSLYTAVFNTAKKEPGVNKTKEGFSLKPGASTTPRRKRKKKGKRKKS